MIYRYSLVYHTIILQIKTVERNCIIGLQAVLSSSFIHGYPGYGPPTPQRWPRHGRLRPGGCLTNIVEKQPRRDPADSRLASPRPNFSRLGCKSQQPRCWTPTLPPSHHAGEAPRRTLIQSIGLSGCNRNRNRNRIYISPAIKKIFRKNKNKNFYLPPTNLTTIKIGWLYGERGWIFLVTVSVISRSLLTIKKIFRKNKQRTVNNPHGVNNKNRKEASVSWWGGGRFARSIFKPLPCEQWEASEEQMYLNGSELSNSRVWQLQQVATHVFLTKTYSVRRWTHWIVLKHLITRSSVYR